MKFKLNPNAKPRRPIDPGFHRFTPGKKLAGGSVHSGLGPVPQRKPKPAPGSGGGAPGTPGAPGASGSDYIQKLVKGYNPNAPLTGKQLVNELTAAVHLQYDPTEREIGRQIAASNDRATRILPAYYQDYEAALARLRGESDAKYQQVGQQIQNDANQSAQQDTAGRQAVADQLAHDAALRGQPVDSSILTTSANAAGARRDAANATYGTVAGQGANQFAYLTNQQGIAHQAGHEAGETELARQRNKLLPDLMKLQKDKGDFAVQFLQNARDNAQKLAIEKATIGAQNYRAQLSAKTTRRGQNLSHQDRQSGQAITARGQNLTHGDKVAGLHAQNTRDRKNRRERRWAHNHPQAKAGKGSGGGKGLPLG